MLANGNAASAASAAKREKNPSVPSSSHSSSKLSSATTKTTATTASSSHPSPSTSRDQKSSQDHPQSQSQTSSRPWLATPGPIKRLFAQFPLQTLPANRLPSSRHDESFERASQSQSGEKTTADTLPALHVFSTPSAAAQGAPSFNPSCLQHQTWLRAHGVRAHTVCSSNHAAPSGVLPFLVLSKEKRTISAAKMWEWTEEHGRAHHAEANSKKDALRRARETAYLSLIEHRLRAAWLLALYLTPANFMALCQPLYTDPTTSSLPVRAALATDLRKAACTALHTLSPPTAASRQHLPPAILPDLIVGEAFPTSRDSQRIYAAAADALHSLAGILGSDAWFFGAERPGRLDIVLFSYIHLMLDDSLKNHWADRRLIELLQPKQVQNLVRHRERVVQDIWGDGPTVVAPHGL